MNEISLAKIRKHLKEKDLDAVFITSNENRRYLSDFRGSDGYLLIGQDYQLLITDSRYTEQAKNESPAYEIFELKGALAGWFPKLIERFAIKRLGFEPGYMTFAFYDSLAECAGCELEALGNFTDVLRSVKTPEEVESIRKAVKISDDAISFVSESLHEGISEKQLAWEIEKFMREQGSEILPFDVIVASGMNAALPHHIPGEKTIYQHEPIIIDIGARVDGYASDLTRTLCIGQRTPMLEEIYQIVLNAQLTAERDARSGMTGNDIDALARDYISSFGYGSNFGHALGHGIGLVCHEYPRVSKNSEDVIEEGMVFTIEPGIYLPKWGGVRIEDTVVFKNGKIEVLSQSVK